MNEFDTDSNEYIFGFQLVNFLSDIGGSLGLYVGISLMTGIEFIALLCNLVQAAFSCLVSRSGPRSHASADGKPDESRLQQQTAA